MKKTIKILSLIVSLTLLLLSASACADPPGKQPDDGTTDPPASSDGNTTDEKDPTDAELPVANDPILADLNGDGTDDTISITFDNEEKSSATIKVINGKDGTELLSDTLTVGSHSHKIGAYYLKVGKSGEPNELVYWNYILPDDRLVFSGSVFHFGMDGKVEYRINEFKTFDIGQNASIESGNIPFGVIIDKLNENIMADCLQYNAYLLLDNQGDTLSVSTKDNMLTPTALTFTLEDFIKTNEGDTPPKDPDDDMDPPSTENTEMAIEEGFRVIATQTLRIPVTEGKVKINRTARLAALQNDKGETALYLDVLGADNTLMASVTWKGYYQLFLTDDGTLILFRIAASPASQRGTAVCQLFTVSDTKISGYDVIELDTPQINLIPGEGTVLNFSYGSPAAEAMYEAHFTDFFYRLEDELGERGMAYMIADNYLDPTSPALYSDTDKVSVPNFEDKAIADKYTWGYAIGLFK